VPTLSVVFSAAAYVGSGDTRNRTRIAHASVVELGGAGPIASSWVGLTRPGGSARVRFSQGWGVIPATDLSRGRHVRIVGGAPEAQLELDVAQFGLLAATGPIALAGDLVIEASVDGDSVTGVVRNQLPFAVEETVVLLDGRLTPIGKLAVGEERAWRLEVGPTAVREMGFADQRVILDNGSFDDGQSGRWFQAPPWQLESVDAAGGRDGVVNQALWQALRSDPGSGVSTSGIATVLGWTRELDLGIRLNDRRQSPAGRTALVARTEVTAPPGRVPAVAVHRDVVRGRFNDPFGEGSFLADPKNSDATILRFTLPPGADRTLPLELRSSIPLNSIEFWVGDAWGAAPGGAVPAGAAASSGVLFARITGVNFTGDQHTWITVGEAR
ncbi:MAG: hypothetical protein ACRDV9_01855, partial [Acidimicrobiia bacterium]